MKNFCALFLFISLVQAHGDPPKKDSLSKYSQLWTKSLVTVPPPPPVKAVAEVVTPLDDYVLGGYTKTERGYFVSLINTKDKTRLTLSPSSPEGGGYRVLQVQSDDSDYMSAKVLIKVGQQQKWIGYEEKFLTLSRPAAPAAAKNKQQLPAPIRNATKKSTNSGTSNSGKKPRVRRVPVPPTK